MDKVNLLTEIKEGDIVYDRDGDKVGTVAFVQMTDEIPAQPGPETATSSTSQQTHKPTLVDEIAEVLAGKTQLPEELREKLIREGFIRIQTGMFHADRFAMPEHIHEVNDDGIHLNMASKDLLKSR